MKFRKKPIVVTAFQMTHDMKGKVKDWPDWLRQAWNKPWGMPGAFFPGYYLGQHDERYCIQTLEGAQVVSWGDWIIKGVVNELYPCKPNVFEQTYEKVGD